MNIYKGIYDMEKEMCFLKIGIYNKYSLSFIRISCMIFFLDGMKTCISFYDTYLFINVYNKQEINTNVY